MMDNCWDNMLSGMIEFCVGRHILLPNMEDIEVLRGQPSLAAQQVTYYHRFYVDLYCHVINSIVQELNDRFPKTIIEFLTCISCFNPTASFAAFDMVKLLQFAQFYHLNVNDDDLLLLRSQFDRFLMLLRRDEALLNLNSISCVTQKWICGEKLEWLNAEASPQRALDRPTEESLGFVIYSL
ncbi:uncharacterized protein LOC111392241 [Olea europaea var. sylvestris]|uniref:uncharacterized protein LOC111392241 n=1 Tax=Olea europaea var. sylvestris TaxID=158386 RepID=UPI000C1D0296|nr:uncharacterized protein LOC111392241 [Olea europaea var. sylvestris]